MIGARLSHRNIMSVFDVRPVGSFWIVLMEFIQGDRLTGIDLDDKSAKRCFGQLADAVHLMGQKLIVHRDIKPDNIVVRRSDGSPVIVDLGLAVDLSICAPKEFGVAGSPLFMPPEGFDGMVTTAFDPYSLGVTAFYVLTKGDRVQSKGMRELIDAKRSGEFARDLDMRLRGKSSALRSWIMDLINADQEMRRRALDNAIRWTKNSDDKWGLGELFERLQGLFRRA